MRRPHCLEVNLAAAIKQVVYTPIMTANRIVKPHEAEKILEKGWADFIGLGRALMADPKWPKKAKEEKDEEIRFCIGCMECLKKVLGENTDMRCAINTAVGQESVCRITPTTEPKVIFVAGGGPAGMEAARVAALRGHKVRLFEKEKLGGQLNLACLPPGKDDMKYFVDFEVKQLNKLGVKVQYDAFTAEMVSQKKPDAVIVATGGQPLMPSIPGINKKQVVTAWQVLKGEVGTGSRIVVLGGGEVGAETAEYLATKGKRVTIVEMLDSIAANIERTTRLLLMFSLNELGVTILTKAIAKEITDQGVIVDHMGKQEIVDADTIVLALGSEPVKKLADQLAESSTEFFVVGDCSEPRMLPDAVKEGFKVGLEL
jgi:pyruvate/2-oxoglutarate dehydrogenase complex dihydrolipoamide dehydrogenase (E3) component